MKTFYLKHDVESVLLDSLKEFSETDVVIDYIGVIYKTISEDEFVQLDGFHANVLCDELPCALEQFLIDAPTKPSRVFFGE